MSTVDNDKLKIDSLEICKEIEIAAPIDIVFDSVLAELGPEGEMPGGKPFPMKLEAWPGGRWFRDLGNDAGHLWGVVQVIKPPTLIEIWGPLMMSNATTNHLQYRLKEEGSRTRVLFRHQGIGLISEEHRSGLTYGWQYWIEHLARLAEKRMQAKR